MSLTDMDDFYNDASQFLFLDTIDTVITHWTDALSFGIETKTFSGKPKDQLSLQFFFFFCVFCFTSEVHHFWVKCVCMWLFLIQP